MPNPSELLADLAIGLIAGAFGTAAMTAAQTAEMHQTGRSASTTPAKAAEKLLGADPWTDKDEEKLSNRMHWSYGVALGGACGVLANLLRQREPETGVAFFALAWGAGLTLLPVLKLSAPPNQWDSASLARDAGFHALYAGATTAAFHAVKAGLRRSLPS